MYNCYYHEVRKVDGSASITLWRGAITILESEYQPVESVRHLFGGFVLITLHFELYDVQSIKLKYILNFI